MVSVAVVGEPSDVPTGFESVTLTVSGCSLKRSSGTKTVKLCVVWPGAKTSVPSVCS